MGGLFLFIPDLVRFEVEALAVGAKLPGSRMIPGRACVACPRLALKLWAIERKSHVMALVADEGLALFCGLNAMPKRSFLAEYSSQITPQKVSRLTGLWHEQLTGEALLAGQSLNLDFHSVPYFGEHPVVESHYWPSEVAASPASSRSSPRMPTARCSATPTPTSAKGEEAKRSSVSSTSWTAHHGGPPRHLVFDSKLTTYHGLDRLDKAGITFLTLRRRSPRLLAEVDQLSPSAWRTITLDVRNRKYRTPRIYEQKVRPKERSFRQFFITDLGHEEPNHPAHQRHEVEGRNHHCPLTPSAC